MTKTEQTQTTVQTADEVKKYFDYFKFNLLKTYYIAKLTGKSTDELEVAFRYVNNGLNTYFARCGALKFVSTRSEYDENGKCITYIKVKDIDVNKQAISKAGKEYAVFGYSDKGKAISSAEKALSEAS